MCYCTHIRRKLFNIIVCHIFKSLFATTDLITSPPEFRTVTGGQRGGGGGGGGDGDAKF